MPRNRNRTDYRSLFSAEESEASSELAKELAVLLAVHPPPAEYRERLRRQLLAAARDERFYGRPLPVRLWLSLGVVAAALLSIVGFIAWRMNRPSLPPRVPRVP